ncbi:o-spannin [Salmonella phage SE_PL]|uniref:hypothetical protein n=1 Tax=Salmonella enterica TaxID=28901 RepID=UPI000FDF935C|nr:o-spannin [Salmonella phage Munch]EAR2661154.1 hypothetical protein [Salmonella enterica]ECV9084107.1 hypothetical protein [Salmonella enterica subsp. enterica serovar Infantis]MCP0435792.1 hypothetical protein [Salmonella enterica subsp. enterica serovar Mbandaka]QCW18866.1 hypothetical protein 7t3_0345 [Salmonella phage 7t3]QIG62855.1 o-spannin [Salmonella phage SE_PL]
MRKIFLAIITAFAIIFALTGCADKVRGDVKPIIVQESLLKKCTSDTPLPENPARDANGKIMVDEEGRVLYDGKETMRVLIKWDDIYTDCATTHDSLVDTIRKLQETKEIQTK